MNNHKPSDLIDKRCGYSSRTEQDPAHQNPLTPLSPREKPTISRLKQRSTESQKCYFEETIMNHKKSSDLRAKYHEHLHQGAKPTIHQNANELRKRLTEAEQKLWALLRNRQLKGKKFRRQHAIAYYIADFYCHESKLVIELDGNFHRRKEEREYDRSRTAVLNEIGITVLRFWNEQVINDPENVLLKISEYLG